MTPDHARTLVSGLAPPGASTGAKLDMIEGFRRLLRNQPEPPAWVAELERDVKAGRL